MSKKWKQHNVIFNQHRTMPFWNEGELLFGESSAIDKFKEAILKRGYLVKYVRASRVLTISGVVGYAKGFPLKEREKMQRQLDKGKVDFNKPIKLWQKKKKKNIQEAGH